MDFQKFNKIARLSRDCMITEKIDGTNGQIFISTQQTISEYYALNTDYSPTADSRTQETEETFIRDNCLYVHEGDPDLYIFAGSRKRWITTDNDNFNFAKWVSDNAVELIQKLGEGRHYGEWYGLGIQRNYGLDEKRFALFNVKKWGNPEDRPSCCGIVPVLYTGEFDTDRIKGVLKELETNGSKVSQGFMNPEGIVIYHLAGGHLYKKTIKDDEKPKGQNDS